MDIPPSLLADVPVPQKSTLSRQEKRAQRERQIIRMFHRSGGTLHVRDIMEAFGVTKNAAKGIMNAPIDRAPSTCPWERIDGNKSRFILKGSRRRTLPTEQCSDSPAPPALPAPNQDIPDAGPFGQGIGE